MSMVDILLKDIKEYLHAVYVLTLDASKRTDASAESSRTCSRHVGWKKIPSVRGEVLNNICHSLQMNQKLKKRLMLGLFVTNKRYCTNVDLYIKSVFISSWWFHYEVIEKFSQFVYLV